ncbi:uncharacterized protein LOC126687730 [Mercurialis annua]|uniref:uncharacterized protein LOC126687730 n=1 Tax=Mercurialis annua TaxID=3986 RepID=UPI00215E06D4|nr:uncharacterized protein LOC126687730 [Mercurialis annua]
MADASNDRITINLGRAGQVVKRAATGIGYSDSIMQMQGAGSKRSVRDRLGSNFDGYSSHAGNQLNNKRQRGDSWLTSSNGFEDICIGKDDLRLKLMRKTTSRTAPSNYEQKTMDLRERLSRTVQPAGPPLRTVNTRQNMLAPAPKESSILGQIPSTRRADNLPQMDVSRNSYSPWTLDHIRRRSPDRILGSSRGLSPSRNAEDIQRRPLTRTFDDARTVSYISKDNAFDSRRPVSSARAFMSKPMLPTVATKPAPPPVMSQRPPASGIIQKSSYMVEEQQTVEGLLHSLGLGKYAILFKAEEVDMAALKQMGEGDLKELGIPMGPRKKILLALIPRSKRQS